MTFEDDFLNLTWLNGHITDSHFSERERMGRLLGFLCRMWVANVQNPIGIGVDESTALLIDSSGTQVVGSGSVYVIEPTSAPEYCQAGVNLQWTGVPVTEMTQQGISQWTISVRDGFLE